MVNLYELLNLCETQIPYLWNGDNSTGLTFQGCGEARDIVCSMPNLGKCSNGEQRAQVLFQWSVLHDTPHQRLVALKVLEKPKSRCWLAGIYLEAWGEEATSKLICVVGRICFCFPSQPSNCSSSAPSLESWTWSCRQRGSGTQPVDYVSVLPTAVFVSLRLGTLLEPRKASLAVPESQEELRVQVSLATGWAALNHWLMVVYKYPRSLCSVSVS